MKNSAASEEMLKAEYEKIKATITGTEYRARHILVEKEAEAKDIIAKLKKDPGLFEKLAMEKSKDTGSKVKGGELGWFDLSRMVPEFGAAASKLEKGAITQEPVKTQFGYHVIQLEDTRPIEAPPFEDVKPQLAQHLQQQSVQKQMEELKAKAKIEMAGAPAPAAAPAAPQHRQQSNPSASPRRSALAAVNASRPRFFGMIDVTGGEHSFVLADFFLDGPHRRHVGLRSGG